MSEDVYGFSETDARSLIDTLNPRSVGTIAPAPVRQLHSVLVKVTTAITAASGSTPGAGAGEVVQLVEAPGPVFTVVTVSPPLSLPIKSLRSTAVAVNSLVLAVREQMKNEWWIS